MKEQARPIEIHIDELVLHGFAPGDRQAIASALERELQRLFLDRGTPHLFTADQHIAQMRGGSFEVSPGARPETIGTQVAQAVYGSLKAQ